MLQNDLWYEVKSGEKQASILLKAGDELLVQNRSPHSFAAQELVELWHVSKVAVPQYKKSDANRIVARMVGFAKVQTMGDSLTRIHISQMFSDARISDLKVKKSFNLNPIQVETYEPVREVRYEDMGAVFYALEPKLVVGPYSYIMSNQGSDNGFRPGNGVALWEHEIIDPGLPPRLLGRGIVVSSNRDESCILVRELYSSTRRIAVGNRVSLTHKAVLK